MAKPKLALYWAASCGGCEITVVDIEEKILDVADFFDIVFWPCVMDFKYKDIEDGILKLDRGVFRSKFKLSMSEILMIDSISLNNEIAKIIFKLKNGNTLEFTPSYNRNNVLMQDALKVIEHKINEQT